MNVTLLSLVLSSTSFSPLFSCCRVCASSVYLNRHFSPFVFDFSDRMRYLCLQKSRFSELLSPAVVVESDTEYKYQIFTDPLVISDEQRTYYIEDCLFYNCKNTNANGGGLYISYSSASLDVQRSGFTGCKAESGGAIYAVASYIDLNVFCAMKCSAEKYPCYYLSAKKSSSVQQSHIVSFDNEAKNSCANMYCNEGKMAQTNFSRNSLASADHISYHYSVSKLTVTYCNFERNECTDIMYLRSNDEELTAVNFVKNEGKEHLIEIDSRTYSVYFRKFYIQEDDSTYLVNKYCTFEECYFDVSENDLGTKISKGSPQLRNCKFEVTATAQLGISNSLGCWTYISTSSDVTAVSSGTGVSITLILAICLLIVVIGVAIFFIVMRKCRPQYESNQLLTYV